MQQADQRRFDSLIRAQDFLGTDPVAMAAIAHTAAKKQIDDAVNQLREHITAQGTTQRIIAGQSGRIRELARQLVRAHIAPITKFARANLKGVSDYAALTKTPRAKTTKKLVTQAYALARAAAPYANAMTDAGFPADTVDKLLAATNELNDAIVNREPMRASRVQSTKSIERLLEDGRDGVRKIDAVLDMLLCTDAPALASWRSARRVNEKPGAVRRAAG